MRPHRSITQQVEHQQKEGKGQKLNWQTLSLIGIGSIVGAGFFLGSGLAIQNAGPAVLLLYLYSGVTAFLVFSALAEMTANDKSRNIHAHCFSMSLHRVYFLNYETRSVARYFPKRKPFYYSPLHFNDTLYRLNPQRHYH